jgi:hypothetical protein
MMSMYHRLRVISARRNREPMSKDAAPEYQVSAEILDAGGLAREYTDLAGSGRWRVTSMDLGPPGPLRINGLPDQAGLHRASNSGRSRTRTDHRLLGLVVTPRESETSNRRRRSSLGEQ